MIKIKQILSQEDTVLFIGSGLSLWSGLPSWSGLIEELAEFIELMGENSDLIRAEAQRGDLLQAASYGFDKLSKQQIGEFIRRSCKYGIAQPHEIHKKVVSLGTRCFVTTNYDNLLEEALRKWQPNRFFRPAITNRQLTETAEIVHARAMDFIFKPHGDAGDSDSIILTREQYRQLLPQGERQNALESLKMILASRPVVYIGFGLRDPDFMYVRDLLANTYKGGIRDHYAIMADISEAESNYWRRNYGVHLVGYSTTTLSNGKKDHSSLLTLLDSFLERSTSTDIAINKASTNTYTPDIVLSLARHAARNEGYQKENPELPIRVKSGRAISKAITFYKLDKFDDFFVERLLDEGPNRIVLVGLPGAGKSYALKQATARLAKNLNKICLSELFNEKNVTVPIFVDLKLYQGSLEDLVNQNLPQSLPLDQLISKFKFKIFIDSFNEMPREHWENGSYEADFSIFEKSIGQSTMIISSRTSDGLDKLGFPIYHLDSIEKNVLDDELKKLGIEIDGYFKNEVRDLLQKPFYFHLVSTGAVSIPKQAHPKDFYQSLFENLEISFAKRFGFQFNLERNLALIAYDAINRGEEAYPLGEAINTLTNAIKELQGVALDATDLINWLVSKTILIPYSGARVAFIHQSVTEYLAARELAHQYQISPKILKQKLTLTRWDQALFLTLSLLPQSHTEEFFKDIVATDFRLALNASKYIEYGRDEIVSNLLKSIQQTLLKQPSLEHNIGWFITTNLPISDIHEPELRELMTLPSTTGGAAVIRLSKIKGNEFKDELLKLLISSRHDYNYCCNGVARALKKFITRDDLPNIVSLADSIEDEIFSTSDEDYLAGFISGTAYILKDIEIENVITAFIPPSNNLSISEIRARIICSFLCDTDSEKALEFAAHLILRGINNAATSIYFIAKYSKAKNNLQWDSFTINHIVQLISLAENKEEKSWASRALECICSARSDLSRITSDIASTRSGISKAVLMHCARRNNNGEIFEALNEILLMSENDLAQQAIHMLEELDINWLGQEELFIKILKIGNPEITLSLLEQVHRSGESAIEEVDIGDITWWLEWLSAEARDSSTQSYFLKDRMSWFFANFTNIKTQRSFIEEFNKPDFKYKKILSDFILRHQNDITSDDLSQNSINFLINDLKNNNYKFHGHLLSHISTENIILEKLLPLVSEEGDDFQFNLQEVIRKSGARHGKRYLLN